MSGFAEDFDFTDTAVGPEERLAGLLALDCGLAGALGQVLNRIASYTSFLEEELEDELQQSPAAEQYLQRIHLVLNRAQAWMTRHGQSFAAGAEFESLDMTRLLEGAARRWAKQQEATPTLQLELGDEEVLVNGALYQLQGLLVSLPAMYQACSGSTLAYVQSRARQVDSNVLALVRSRCQGGRFLAVSLADQPLEQLQTVWEQPQSFGDLFLERPVGDANVDLHLLQLYGIVTGHGGEVLLQSTAAGTVMVLLLPVVGKRNQMQAPASLDDKQLYGSETILLVDDEDMIWDVIIDMFQSLGYTVILAANGRDAVDIYRDNPGMIDLVLLDMVMPEMNGRDAFFALQQLDPAVRVLLSSGYVSEDDARDVLEAGAHGFLRKPYRMVDLAKAIRAIFATT